MTNSFDRGPKMKRLLGLTLLLAFGSANAVNVQDFTGYYDCANWTATPDGGSINCSVPQVVEISSNLGGGSSATSFLIAAGAHSQISFDWAYTTTDVDGSFFDPFGYMINGVFTQLTTDGLFTPQGGTAAFEVFTGDVFGFVQAATDSILGSATTIVSNFSAVPEPGTLALLGIGLLGLGLARKKA